MRTILCFSLLFASMVLCFTAEAEAGSLHGIVRDAVSLIPLSGVDVTVHVVNPDSIAYPTTTNAEGAYSITGIVPGNQIYSVVAYKNGYVGSYARIDDLGSQDLVYDIFLEVEPPPPPGGGGGDSSTIGGMVMTPGAGGLLTPVSNATVLLKSINGEFTVQTNDDGRYDLQLPVGIYSVLVSADGYNTLNLGGVELSAPGATVNAILQSSITDVGNTSRPPSLFGLNQNYPNPFNPVTTVSYRLPFPSRVKISIINILGRKVETLVDAVQEAGVKSVNWDGTDVPSGLYFCRMEAKSVSDPMRSFLQVNKMLLIR